MADEAQSGDVKVFYIGSDGALNADGSGGATWVASEDVEPDRVRSLCETHGVALPAAVQASLDSPPPHPEVIRYGDLLFVSYKPTADLDGSRATVVCTREVILSFHPDGEALDSILRSAEAGWALPAPTTLGVLIELVDATSRLVSSRVFALRREVAVLAAEIESGDRSLESAELLRLKADAAALEARYEDYLYCLAEFAKFETSVNQGSAQPALVQFQVDLDRGLATVARLKTRITDLHQFQVRESDATTNRRLKTLTILSAIYLPATLIAGIYGMNFDDIPITEIPSGYAIVIAIMAVVVVGQLVLFYRRGWFR